MFQTKRVEKIKTHSLCSITLWKTLQLERPRETVLIRLMRIACWITRGRDTHTRSEYIILIALPLQQW
jgi:hypothetical protein